MTTYIHTSSRVRLEAVLRSSRMGVLISGATGVGLFTIATEYSQNLDTILRPTDKDGAVDARSGSISVDAIRELYTQTRGRRTKQQTVIIDDADKMGPSAQAAFLKLLEEPPALTQFILTSHRPSLLLSTIRSRLQHVHIAPIDTVQTAQLLDDLQIGNPTTVAQLKFLASGLPAEITRLASDENYFEQRAGVIRDAKILVSGSPYDKIVTIQKYTANKETALRLIEASMLLTMNGIKADPRIELAQKLQQLLSTKEAIDSNCNIKLQLANLVV